MRTRGRRAQEFTTKEMEFLKDYYTNKMTVEETAQKYELTKNRATYIIRRSRKEKKDDI